LDISIFDDAIVLRRTVFVTLDVDIGTEFNTMSSKAGADVVANVKSSNTINLSWTQRVFTRNIVIGYITLQGLQVVQSIHALSHRRTDSRCCHAGNQQVFHHGAMSAFLFFDQYTLS